MTRLALALVLTLGLLEVLLRITAPYLAPEICNELVRNYSFERGGIYYLEPKSKMHFCYPNDHHKMAVSGMQWIHETDQRGLRNPPNTDHEILIFGDSLVYGHGFNEADSAVSQLRQRHGWKVYNMACQGYTIWQQYILFRFWFDELKPKHIILCPYGNDFRDIQTARSPEEQADPPELKEGFIGEVRYNRDDPQLQKPMGNWFSASYCYRLFKLAKKRLAHQQDHQFETDPAVRTAGFNLAGYYYARLFADMLQRCRAAGCTLDLVFIDTSTDAPYWSEEEVKLDQYFRLLCARNQVPYYSTRALLKGHPEYYQPPDGHFNPLGNRIFADFLASQCPKTWRKD